MSNQCIQIIGGEGLKKAFDYLSIKANCLYQSKKHPQYEVWELSPEDFETIDFMDEKDWHDDWGWWRIGYCIYQGAITEQYIVNGKLMYGYTPDVWDDDEPIPTKYLDYHTWLQKVFRISSETNFAIFANSLAKDNNMTLCEFMQNYQP